MTNRVPKCCRCLTRQCSTEESVIVPDSMIGINCLFLFQSLNSSFAFGIQRIKMVSISSTSAPPSISPLPPQITLQVLQKIHLTTRIFNLRRNRCHAIGWSNRLQPSVSDHPFEKPYLSPFSNARRLQIDFIYQCM